MKDALFIQDMEKRFNRYVETNAINTEGAEILALSFCASVLAKKIDPSSKRKSYIHQKSEDLRNLIRFYSAS